MISTLSPPKRFASRVNAGQDRRRVAGKSGAQLIETTSTPRGSPEHGDKENPSEVS